MDDLLLFFVPGVSTSFYDFHYFDAISVKFM